MCIQVIFRDSGVTARCMGEFEQQIGRAPFIRGGYHDVAPDCCLCPVNIERSLKAAGFQCEEDDVFDYIAWRNP